MNSASRAQYLDAMGIQVWQERGNEKALLEATVVEQEPLETIGLDTSPQMGAVNIPEPAIGIGPLDAKWFVVRDASSEEREDALLNGMLQAVGLRREQIYIVNGMTNQPKILQNEIERIQPSVILVMGEKMAQVLLNRQETLSVLRTQPVNTGSIPTVVTFSTAYLLKKPLAKRLAWHDLQRAQQFVLE